MEEVGPSTQGTSCSNLLGTVRKKTTSKRLTCWRHGMQWKCTHDRREKELVEFAINFVLSCVMQIPVTMTGWVTKIVICNHVWGSQSDSNSKAPTFCRPQTSLELSSPATKRFIPFTGTSKHQPHKQSRFFKVKITNRCSMVPTSSSHPNQSHAN